MTRVFNVYRKNVFDLLSSEERKQGELSQQLLETEPTATIQIRFSKKSYIDTEGSELAQGSSLILLNNETYLAAGENHHEVNVIYQYRYCLKCDNIKPPRTHHCSACKQCVMKMDHHCPWVGNCVGLRTHKTFWLFLFYSTIGLVTVCLTTYLYCRDT
jgi:hypothetical protein